METVGNCPRCGRPVPRAKESCAWCDRASDGADVARAQRADSPSTARLSRPAVQAGCTCGSYAGVKVHALNCPEATTRA
jgi:hypothetical protein